MKTRSSITLAAGIVLLAALALFSGGCRKTESALLSEFKSMTETTPTARGLTEAVSFMDKYIVEVSEEGASRLVLAYEDYLLRFLDAGEAPDPEAPVSDWFVIPASSEEAQPKIDYQALLTRYGERLSPELCALFEIKSLETTEPAVADAEILRTYPEILDRALKTENLLKEHNSEDAVRADSLEYYKKYLFLLMAGSDHTPVFDYDTGLFSEEAKAAYEDFIVANPDTVLADVLTEYFSYLNNIGFQIDYGDPTENKVFYDTCDYLINEALESF
ncbi:MAG: hypothetical protein PHH65_07200 [Eubacteriales bacterium]|jgi:hypothetical protein|nr:hypothetical protein [Eubacteriales bacterium]NLV70840.1 hypothetical protein [Clostridiales bacterium]HPF18161.1 hypothetical protein [Bacillota bacterium]